MALNRTVTLTLPESICARIEQLEKQPIETVLQELITSYLQDKRRTGIETVEIGVSWPPDWYEQMLRRCTDGTVSVDDPAVASRTIVTAAAAFIYTESLARSEGDDGTRWTEFTRMIKGYLS